MNIIRKLNIRQAMLIILGVAGIFLSGGVYYTIHTLSDVRHHLNVIEQQQDQMTNITNIHDLFFQAEDTLESIFALYNKNDAENAKATYSTLSTIIDTIAPKIKAQNNNEHLHSVELITSSSLNLLSLLEKINQNQTKEYLALSQEKHSELRNKFLSAVKSNADNVNLLRVESFEFIKKEVTLSLVLLLGILVGYLLLLLLIDRYILECVVKPLRLIQRHLHTLASGELTHSLKDIGNNCIGRLVPLIHTMQSNWNSSVIDIRKCATDIYRSAAEIAAGNTDLSSRTEAQASALEETAASMEQLSAVVKQNADNAGQASQLAKMASVAANDGGEIISTVVESMGEISKRSQTIVDIIGVINSIAFQTNILALNAAVEAARAGEQGRGFAVVAAEVRTLAQRSAQSAKEIENLIAASVESVTMGTEQVSKAGEAMNRIVRDVMNVTDIMSEIASATHEQSQGIMQVGQAVVEMDCVTQQNAALVEQSSVASTLLEEQAKRLTEVVSIFKIDNDITLPSNSLLNVEKKALSTHKSSTKNTFNDNSHNWETF